MKKSNIEKKVYGHIDKGYAIHSAIVGGRRKLFFASEARGECHAYDFESGEDKKVWDAPGGTMNIVSIPGKDGEFLATQKFFPVFDAKKAILVHGQYNSADDRWETNEVLETPYLHRFDIVKYGQTTYLIGATLCENKEFVQDWSTVGSIYVGTIKEDINEDFELKEIYKGITKNHGYNLDIARNRFLVSGVEGLFEVKIPDFSVKKLINREISDMAVCDIDGDGEVEIATIEQFHGNEMAINKYSDGVYKKVFSHPIEFGHVLWGGEINGEKAFIVGSRRGDQRIEVITYNEGDYTVTTIDEGVGPSQLIVFSEGQNQYALSANREANELAVYKF